MPEEIKKPAPTFDQLVTEKIKASGNQLDREQATQIVRAQLAHDKNLAEAAELAAKDDKKKPAKD
jgi:hypothetical protein